MNLEWTTTEIPPTPAKFDPDCPCTKPGSEATYKAQVCLPLAGKVKPIDRCLHHLVAALNAGGVETVASCCGHGQQRGRIDLADGRTLAMYAKGEFAAELDRLRATPPESKQRVDGFLGADEPDARVPALTAEVERLRGELVVMGNNAELFRQSMYAVEEQATKLRGELAAMTAERDHWKSEHSLKCYDADHFEMMRADLSALRERYAGLERAARGWLDVVEKEMRAHPCGPRVWSLHDPGLGIRDAISAIDSAPATTDAAQPANPPKILDGSPAPTEAPAEPVDPRPLCIRCGKRWAPGEGIDATAHACNECFDEEKRAMVGALLPDVPRIAVPTDAAREAAAEILAAFPRCRECPAPARFEDAWGVPRCGEHTLPVGTSPVDWLPALEVAERIAKGRADG